MLKLLDRAVDIIQGNRDDLSSSCFSYDINVGDHALVTSFRSFLSSPLFAGQRDENSIRFALYDAVILSVERLLRTLAKGYEENCKRLISQSGKRVQDLSTSVTPLHDMLPFESDKSKLVDLELDVSDNSGEVDILAGGVKISSDVSSSVEKWKLGMISLISEFFPLLHGFTWDILFELLDKESDPKVVLYLLASHALEYRTSVTSVLLCFVQVYKSFYLCCQIGA